MVGLLLIVGLRNTVEKNLFIFFLLYCIRCSFMKDASPWLAVVASFSYSTLLCSSTRMSSIITVRDIHSDISVVDGKLWEGKCNFLKAIGSVNSTIKIITWKILTSTLMGWVLWYVPFNVPHSVYILSIKRSLCSRAASQLYKFKIAHICNRACVIYL